MRVLFIHQNFPAQFGHLARRMADRGDEVRALAVTPGAVPGVRISRYRPVGTSTRGIHVLAADFESKMIRALSCFDAMLRLRRGGFVPDIVIAHPGWGESAFVREVWPTARVILFLEYFYGAPGGDSGFDPEFVRRAGFVARAKGLAKNASLLLAFEQMDHGLSPTRWQLSTHPPRIQARSTVIFDGVNTRVACPRPDARSLLGRLLPPSARDAPLVTFVARCLEPYRGVHIWMRALPEVLARCPNAVAVFVGGDRGGYGAQPPAGTTWKERFFREIQAQVDPARVHFLGKLAYQDYLLLLQATSCHVYLTYPFVLSWSCVEAMSVGATLVASRTAPVQEFVTDGDNGLLVDFFDVRGLSERVADVLENPAGYRRLGLRARETVVERYDLETRCLPGQLGLVERVSARVA